MFLIKRTYQHTGPGTGPLTEYYTGEDYKYHSLPLIPINWKNIKKFYSFTSALKEWDTLREKDPRVWGCKTYAEVAIVEVREEVKVVEVMEFPMPISEFETTVLMEMTS